MRKNIFLSIVGLLAVVSMSFLYLGNTTVHAASIVSVSPALLNNNANLTIEIKGHDFKQLSNVYIGDEQIDSEKIDVKSSSSIFAVVPQGMTPGVYDIRVVSAEDVDSMPLVFPDAVTVYGDNIKLKMLSFDEVQIPGGMQFRMKFNKEVKIKALMGGSDQELQTLMRKPYSAEQVVPFSISIENNLKYYVFKTIAKDKEGDELETFGIYKLTRQGVVNDDKPVLKSTFPDISFDVEGFKASLNFTTNKYSNVKVQKKLFAEDEWNTEFTDVEFTKDHKVILKDMLADTNYLIRISGETEKKEKFEQELQFYFADLHLVNVEVEEEPQVMPPSVATGEELKPAKAIKPLYVPTNHVVTINTVEKLWKIFDNLSLEILEAQKTLKLLRDEAFSLEVQENKDNVSDTEEKDDFVDLSSYAEFNNAKFSKFIPEIEALVAHGIIKGNEGKFYPKNEVTRAEFAVLLCRANDQNEKKVSAFFTDVPSSHFAYDCLSSLVDKSVVRGHGDGKFNPDDTIKRGEAITMLVRLFDLKLPTEFKDGFIKDIASDYALWNYIQAAHEEGWLLDTAFRPNDTLRRIEAFNLIAVVYGFSDSLKIDEFDVMSFSDVVIPESTEEEIGDARDIETGEEINNEEADVVETFVDTSDSGNGSTDEVVESGDDGIELDDDLMDLLENLL